MSSVPPRTSTTPSNSPWARPGWPGARPAPWCTVVRRWRRGGSKLDQWRQRARVSWEETMVVPERFFDETTDQSVVKAEIVEKYFDAWASIIIGARDAYAKTPDERIGYVDLFAGPGRYKDGAVSTPLKVLRKAIEKPEHSQRLVTIFNDKDEANARMLEREIAKLPGIERLQYRPEVWNKEVGSQVAREFERIDTIPILA